MKKPYISSTRGCGGRVERKKTRVGSERKRRTELQSEFQLIPVTPWDEVVQSTIPVEKKQKTAAAAAAAAQPPKDSFDKHLFFGPIIFFSSSSFWPKRHPSISLLCHQIEACQARGKGWRMKKNQKKKIPFVQKGDKEEHAAIWRVVCRRKAEKCFSRNWLFFRALARRCHAEEASASSIGRDVVLLVPDMHFLQTCLCAKSNQVVLGGGQYRTSWMDLCWMVCWWAPTWGGGGGGGWGGDWIVKIYVWIILFLFLIIIGFSPFHPSTIDLLPSSWSCCLNAGLNLRGSSL